MFKAFSKPIQNETVMNKNSYPTFRHRNTGGHDRLHGCPLQSHVTEKVKRSY